jgi:hypothetical protein
VLDQVNLTRLLILASFGIAMLAAFGCERFLYGTADERRRMLLAAALTALLPVLATVALHPGWLADSKQAVNQLLGRISSPKEDVISLAAVLRWLGFSAAALVLLAAFTRFRAHARPVLAALIALAAADLLLIGSGYNPAISEAQAMPPTPPAISAISPLPGARWRA